MVQLDFDLFGSSGLPEGFAYRPDFVSAEEEAALTAQIGSLPFKPFEFRGYEGKRRVVSFGWRYDFGDQRMHEAEPIPSFLRPVRDRAAAFAGLEPEAFAHALVTEYAPGAPIGWHRDRPQFEDVVGVSLLAPCTFRFRRKAGAKWERASFVAQPRSAYLLRGSARSEWEHSIPPVEALRYSITFRSLRR
ncbi:MAG TPA: alpha-ketoglutarate-dependent dioxygenase AlkB [Caulobacteraceae bacterium]|nr:alpha-ketoglutarate-dependent dioxygenase AlkB [Caulobacteraceae bacterium]